MYVQLQDNSLQDLEREPDLLGILDIKGLKRSSRQRCSVKKVFLEISQNSKENACVRVSFQLYYKKGSDTGVFL